MCFTGFAFAGGHLEGEEGHHAEAEAESGDHSPQGADAEEADEGEEEADEGEGEGVGRRAAGAFLFRQLQDNSKLTTSQIKQWVSINSNKYIMKLWNWKLSVTAKDAISKGLKGKDIGKYIRDEEEKLFLS